MQQDHVRIGDVVGGKYRVDRVIGMGGMGLVVSAVHEQLEQRVALKFLLPSIVDNQEIVDRFLREARSAVKIHSEHVARVFDVGTHQGVPYMVMEYLEGRDVAEVIAGSGAMTTRDAAGYVLEACDAIAEAHALGIVHRDLKPANLFLANRPSGKPIIKVLDFGISKLPASEKDRVVTNATTIMGSPSYMSPEQLVASASVDARSDIWSLGVVLYEMVSASLPFHAESMPELVGVILQQPPRSFGNVPPEMRVIIERCLQKNREQRYASIAELARALLPLASPRHAPILERIEGVLGISQPASVAPARSASASVSPAQQTFAPTTTATAQKSGAATAVLVALAVVIVGVGGAFAWIRVQRARDDSPVVTTNAPAATSAPPTAQPIIAPDPTFTTVASASAPVAPVASAPTAIVMHAPHAHASAASSAAPASSACKTVSFFDSLGRKHFRLECPP